MAKKTKKVRKARTTKVVKKKKKAEPDLSVKHKPGPTLPKSSPKAAVGKVAKKGKRYTAKEKKDILAKYNSLRESGTNAYDAAKKVGISYITIRSWEKKEGLGRRQKGTAATKPQQTKSTATGGLSMVLPNGNRIEGLTVDQLIKIVKSV